MSQPKKMSVYYLPHISELHPRPPFEDMLGRNHPLHVGDSSSRGGYLSDGKTSELVAAAYSYPWDKAAYFPLYPRTARFVTTVALALGLQYESVLTRGIGLFELDTAANISTELRVKVGARVLETVASDLGTSRHRALVRADDELAHEIYEKAGFSATGLSGKYNGQSYHEMAFDPHGKP